MYILERNVYVSLPQQLNFKELTSEKHYKTPRRKSIMGREEKEKL